MRTILAERKRVTFKLNSCTVKLKNKNKDQQRRLENTLRHVGFKCLAVCTCETAVSGVRGDSCDDTLRNDKNVKHSSDYSNY